MREGWMREKLVQVWRWNKKESREQLVSNPGVKNLR
jgi:hypothetical protein